MGDDAIVQVLQDFEQLFTQNNIFTSAFRQIGWWIATKMADFAESCADLYDVTFGLVDITEWEPVSEFIYSFGPLLKGILAVSLFALAMIYLFGKNKKRPVLTNLLILVVVVNASAYVFSALNDLSVLFKDSVAGTAEEENTYSVMNANLYDLLYIDEQGGLANLTEDAIPQYPELTKEDAELIDITEVVNYDSDQLTTDEAGEILKHRLFFRQGEEPRLMEVSNGIGWNSGDDADFGNTFYYRYTFQYGSFYLTTLALLVVYLCLSYKCLRIIYNLLASRILAPVMAADLGGGQKIVKVLTGIRDGYYALCFTAVTLRCFIFFQSYLQTKTELSSVARGILLLFIAWVTVDGADIMERISGVDAGLSGGSGKLLAAGHFIGGALRAGFGAAGFVRQNQMMKNMKSQTQALQNMAQGNGAGSGNGSGTQNMPDAGKGDPQGSGDSADAGSPGDASGGNGSQDNSQNDANSPGMGNMPPDPSGQDQSPGSGDAGQEQYSAADQSARQMERDMDNGQNSSSGGYSAGSPSAGQDGSGSAGTSMYRKMEQYSDNDGRDAGSGGMPENGAGQESGRRNAAQEDKPPENGEMKI